jgi:hypothetical protein
MRKVYMFIIMSFLRNYLLSQVTIIEGNMYSDNYERLGWANVYVSHKNIHIGRFKSDSNGKFTIRVESNKWYLFRYECLGCYSVNRFIYAVNDSVNFNVFLYSDKRKFIKRTLFKMDSISNEIFLRGDEIIE